MGAASDQLALIFRCQFSNPDAQRHVVATWHRSTNSIKREAEAKQARRIDPEAMADRPAVTAAFRGASTKASESQLASLGRMGNNEFREHVRNTHGFDPGV